MDRAYPRLWRITDHRCLSGQGVRLIVAGATRRFAQARGARPKEHNIGPKRDSPPGGGTERGGRVLLKLVAPAFGRLVAPQRMRCFSRAEECGTMGGR